MARFVLDGPSQHGIFQKNVENGYNYCVYVKRCDDDVPHRSSNPERFDKL